MKKTYQEILYKYSKACNFGQIFHFVTQFLFTIDETELDYYHQKVHIRVASRVAIRLKSWELRKLGNFNKSLKHLDLMATTHTSTQKPNFDFFW